MASERSAKDKAMASHLKAQGVFHGKRLTSPARNSGGLTLTNGPGSAAYQRRVRKAREGRGKP